MEFLSLVKESIIEASKFGLVSKEDGTLTGFSGEKLVGLLQRLSISTLTENTCYLEVGVYQGLTLLSVAKEIGEREAFGIDNFAYFDKQGINHGIVKERIKKLNISNAKIINSDYEDALENLKDTLKGKKVGVYFIDGPHDYRSQLMCLQLIKPYLAENAVILIDDCNYRHVRQANRDFLKTHAEFKLAFESYTPQHPLNLSEENRKAQLAGWWNGINVIVTDKNNQLPDMLPATFRSRTLFENDHGIHSTKHPEVIPFLLKLTDFLSPIVYSFSKLKRKKEIIKGDFKAMNTYSNDLCGDHLNQGLR